MTHIKMETLPRMTIKEFCGLADTHVVVRERAHLPQHSSSRYYAKLEGVEILDDGMLRSEYNNGTTPEGAIAGLPRVYTDRRLVLRAYQQDRKEFGPFVFLPDAQEPT